MKRKILFIAMIMALISCLFAITSYATEIPEWSSITTVSGMADKSVFGDDGKAGATSRVLMSDGITYPAYYICKNQTSLSIDLGSLNTNASKSYTKADIIKLEIPKGTTTLPDNVLSLSYGYSKLVSVEIPYGVTSIGQLAFRSTPIANPLVLPESVTTIKQYAFKGTNIPSVVIPSSVTSFGTDSFSECPYLAEVYCKSADIPEMAFFCDPSLTTIKLENTVTIGTRAFCHSTSSIYLNITSLELPDTLTTIKDYAFTRTKVTKLVIPASVTSMGMGAFSGSPTLEEVVVLGPMLGTQTFSGCDALKRLVLTENFVTFGSSCLGVTPNNSTFITYYTGTDSDRVLALGSSTSRFSLAKKYSYTEYTTADPQPSDSFMFIYDCNLCEVAFDGAHLDDGNPCVINCERCELEGVAEANPIHNGGAPVIIFENGFNNVGKKAVKCQNEGCAHEESVAFPAIFECLGFSTNDDGTAIATGFSIAHESLTEYEAVMGKTVSFGIVIFNPKYLGDGSFLNNEGKLNASDGYLMVDIGTEYSSCSLSVQGFNASNSGIELVFAGFAYTDDISNADIFQKEYVGTSESPVLSSMASKVTRGDTVLYTVKIGTVLTPAQITTGKESLTEYTA